MQRLGWFVAGGVALGLLGSLLVRLSAGLLANPFSGLAQSPFNAGVLLVAAMVIGWHVLWTSSRGCELSRQLQTLGSAAHSWVSLLNLLWLVVAVAVLRKGSAVVLLLYGMRVGGFRLGGRLAARSDQALSRSHQDHAVGLRRSALTDPAQRVVVAGQPVER